MTKKILTLDKYHPRPYQIPILEAVQKYKRVFIVLPRRSGKDLTLFSCLIDKALERRGLYLYLLPTIEQCRRCIFEAMTIQGQSFLGIIPPELLKDVNLSRMTVTLVNGSKIVFTGYENYSRLLGANALGIVFSEWATSITAEPYRYLRPMVTASGGFAWFCTTPRSKNHAYDLFMRAKNLDHWWTYLLTVDDTRHVTQEDIKNEQLEDETLSDDMVQQEYYCSWTIGASGQFYNKMINEMRYDGRLSLCAYDSRYPCYTSWDFGWNDPTCITFFQYINGTVRIFEYIEKTQTSLEDLIKLVLAKPYVYQGHIAPHDAKVHEFSTGATRIETASSLGLDFTLAPDLSIDDGIHTAQSVLKRCWIDEPHCARLVKCLENYHAKLNEKTSEYSREPVHDWASHGCFTADTLILTRNGMHPIINVKENDEVLTLEGWQKCSAVKLTRKNAQLVEVKFVDGTKVKCTPDHLFLTEKGWISAKNLEKGFKIQSALMNSPNTLLDHCSGCCQKNDITKKVDRVCIDLFGKMLLEIYQKIAIFITKMVIYPITIFITWFVFQLKSICTLLNQKAKAYHQLAEWRLETGTNRLKALNGIDVLQLDVRVGKNGNELKSYVFGATKNMMDSTEKVAVLKSSVIPIAKPLIIESVKDLCQPEDVYDITIDSVHHFSLSNGAIVHNSDCFRYLAISLELLSTNDFTAADLEARYQRKMNGGVANTSVFGKM